jgi:hypothetical protein
MLKDEHAMVIERVLQDGDELALTHPVTASLMVLAALFSMLGLGRVMR